MNKKKYNYGVIGLGVMGKNLLYNMADNNFAVAGFDLDSKKVTELQEGATPNTEVFGTNSLEEFVSVLECPKKIIVLVPAGKAVDSVLENVKPLLKEGDIVIDAGNTFFEDTERRIKNFTENKFHFVGMGVSGGEKGARRGPSLMPGGDLEVFKQIQPMLEAISAKVNGDPCTAYVGKSSAGNYVKMVHNGIEYAIMQIISEAYDLLKKGANLNNEKLHKVFKNWNEGELNSFLIEITRDIFLKKDDLAEGYLVDKILDKAGAKGTGKWTSEQAQEIGVSIPSIDVAVTSRILSAYKDERIKAAELYPKKEISSPENIDLFINEVKEALHLAILLSYAQGLSLLVKASEEYKFDIPLKDVVKIWRGGCIIRSTMLDTFYSAYKKDENLPNILLDKEIAKIAKSKINSLRKVASYAVSNGIPSLGLQSSLGYFDAYTSAFLPINLVQAQRDFFGAHTYQRTDKDGIFHTIWETENN